MNKVFIRQATLSDAPSIARLVTQLGYQTTPAQMEGRLQAILARPEYVLFLAEANHTVVGLVGAYLTLGLELDGPYGRLGGLVVDEGWRGRGIGRLLLEAVEVWLKGCGASLLLITSGLHRTDAHGFYRHLGYAETGLRFAKKI
jgi:GNAT superfamily N-acetyltransferase